MRISAKGRYALAAMTRMAENYENGERMTVIDLSTALGISKIYLEQVFALLKKGDVITSAKGAQGGYSLSRKPREITAYDILSPIETAIFERNEQSVYEKAPDVELAMNSEVFVPVEFAISAALGGVTLEDLTRAAQKNRAPDSVMFYI